MRSALLLAAIGPAGGTVDYFCKQTSSSQSFYRDCSVVRHPLAAAGRSRGARGEGKSPTLAVATGPATACTSGGLAIPAPLQAAAAVIWQGGTPPFRPWSLPSRARVCVMVRVCVFVK